MQIGPVDLYDFEVPPSISFGGRHRLAIYKLASGQRLIESLGPDDDDIQFQGVFSGEDADLRARALDTLRLSGATVWLTWESFRYPVIVRSLSLNYRSPWWIEYQATCLVAQQSSPFNSTLADSAVLIAADLENAIQASAGTRLPASGLAAVMTGSGPPLPGSTASAAALTAITGYLSSCQTTLLGLQPQVTDWSAGYTLARSRATAFTAAVAAAGEMASLINTQSYVGRIKKQIAAPKS